MTTIRITITLKPGVLDAQGQAVLQGLRTLGHDQVSAVRVGRYIELTVPDGIIATDLDQMCQQFLANPLLEEWRIDDPRRTPLSIGERTG
jgi:phosphoribosylformylglycinamidine synthase